MSDLYAPDFGLPEIAELQQRLSSSVGSVSLEMTDVSDTDEIEAFVIAVLETMGNTYSYREQDSLIRSIITRPDEAEAISCTGCGVEIVLTSHGCAIRYNSESLPTDTIAEAMLQALFELSDPAGMVIVGLAKVWESSSFKMTRHPTTAPQLS